MIWIERKYINLLSPYLRNFKWKKNNLGNCSCPICGDSESNKLKARFYFLERKGKYHVFCHNCGYSRKFTSFLREKNHELYDEYVKEIVYQKVIEKVEEKQQVISQEVQPLQLLTDPLSQLKRVSQFPSTHQVRRYCDGRHIPKNQQHRLYYAQNFMDWTNSIIPNKFIYTKDEPRLVIPLLKKSGEMFAFQGRSLNPESKLRYITITIDYEYPKLFGLEQVDLTRTYYVLEGPIDSLFVDNSIAMAGSDVEDNDFIDDNAVFVLDNQPRNKDVVKKYIKMVKKNHKICIWPERIELKDINEMIMSGMSEQDIKTIIDENTYQGLEALLKVNEWKKTHV